VTSAQRNGIVKVESAGYENIAEYKVKGNKVTLKFDGDTETAEFEITKEKGKAVLILIFDGDEIKLYKK